jgi:carbohydrate-selective porin OprB
MWLQPFPDLVSGQELRNQTGIEAYWKILMTPNLWLTPGFQVVWNPSGNPSVDRIFIPHIKFRLSY